MECMPYSCVLKANGGPDLRQKPPININTRGSKLTRSASKEWRRFVEQMTCGLSKMVFFSFGKVTAQNPHPTSFPVQRKTAENHGYAIPEQGITL